MQAPQPRRKDGRMKGVVLAGGTGHVRDRHLKALLLIQARDYFRHRETAPRVEQAFEKITLPLCQRTSPCSVV